MQNIDKIAIAFAGLVILGSLLFTFFTSDPGSQSVDKINTSLTKIEELRRDQRSQLPKDDPPNVRRQVEKDYSGLSRSAELPAWSFYRRPALALINKPKEVKQPVHNAPQIVEIRNFRDMEAQRPYFEVEFVLPDSQNIEFTEFGARIRSGNGWQDLELLGPELSSLRPGSTSTFAISGLERQKNYDIQIWTRAKSTSDTALAPDEVSQYSEPVGPARLPADFSFEFGTAKPLERGLEITPASAFVKHSYFDYEKGEIVKSRNGRFLGPVRFTEWRKTTPIHGTQWIIYKIEEATNPSGKKDEKIILKNLSTDEELVLWHDDDPARLEEPPVAGPGAASGEASEDSEPESSGEADTPAVDQPSGQPSEPKPKPKDDDDDDWG